VPQRSLAARLGWLLRDYAKRVWDNSGEDNVLFLAGGIAFNIILAALPFIQRQIELVNPDVLVTLATRPRKRCWRRARAS